MTEEEWRMRFADKLAYMIKKRGCTQSEVAEEIGVNEKTLSHYICANRTPKATVLMNLARAFECSPSDLLDFGEKID